MKSTQQNKKTNKYYLYTILILIFILLVGGLLLSRSNTSLKDEVTSHKNEISALESINKTNSVENGKLNETIKNGTNDKNEIEIEKNYQKTAEEFVKLYPIYDVNNVKDKKEKLLKITKPEIADSIVPEDMIKDSELLAEGSEKVNELYSTDPTFKSFYDTSTIYKEYVSPEKYKYFAIVNYFSTSSMGDTENTTYLQFEIEKDKDQLLVTNYKIYNMN